jgi:DNA replication protein DnaC
LLFQGGYGCGTTHLAAAIANFRIGAGFKTLFVNTPDLLDHLRATDNASSNISYDKRFEQVRTTPLLILDDLGMQSNTEWTKEKLYQIFNYRYSNRLPTVITTNGELETIEPRIRSRIVDRNLVSHVKILAPDFRRPFDDKDPSDLSSLYLHEDKTFDRFDISWPNTKKDRDNLRKALNRSQEFAVHPEGWLVLYSNGGYHNGKTHLAAAIANYVAAHGESVIFVYVADLLDHLRATFHPSSGIRYDRRFDEVKNVSLLVLDDLGTENASGWAREKLYQLFNHRYAAKLPTIITTSLNIEDEVDMKLSAKLLDGQLCIPFRIQVKRYQRK